MIYRVPVHMPLGLASENIIQQGIEVFLFQFFKSSLLIFQKLRTAIFLHN